MVAVVKGLRMDEIWPLLLFTAISTATPGSATVMAVASGTRVGFARSLPLVAGLALGLGLGLMAAAAGSVLGAVLVGSVIPIWWP